MNLLAVSIIVSLICGINAYEYDRGFRTKSVRNLRAEPTNLRGYVAVGGEGSGSSSSASDLGVSIRSSAGGATRGSTEHSSGFSIKAKSDGGERIRAEAEAAGKEFGKAIKSTITGGIGLFTKAISDTAAHAAKAAETDVSFRSSASTKSSGTAGSSLSHGSSTKGKHNIELNFNSRSDIRDKAPATSNINTKINTKTKLQSESGIRVAPIMCNSGMSQIDFGIRSDRERVEDNYNDREAVLNAGVGDVGSETTDNHAGYGISTGISTHANSHKKSAIQTTGGIPFGLNLKTKIDEAPEATRTSTSGFSFEANSRSNLNSRKIDSDADNGDAGRGKFTAGFKSSTSGNADDRSSSSLGFETSSRSRNSGNIESDAESRNNAAIKSSFGSEFSLGGHSKSRIQSDVEEDENARSAGKSSLGFKTSGRSSGSELGLSITSGARSRTSGSLSSDGEDDTGKSERANFAAGIMTRGRTEEDADVDLKGRSSGRFTSSIENSGKTRGSTEFSIGGVSDVISRAALGFGGISISADSKLGDEEDSAVAMTTNGGGSARFSYLRSPSRRNYRRLRLSSPPSPQFPYRRHRSSIVIQ